MIESVGFIPSKERKRAKQFDRVISTTNYALNSLARAQAFPANKLEQFSRRVNGLFSPNVSHGVVNIPKEYISSAHTPFLIVSDEDENLLIGSSFVSQVPKQCQLAVERYSEHGFFGIDSDRHASLLAGSQKYHSERNIAMPSLHPYTAARTESRYWGLEDNHGREIHLTGRPIIRFRSTIASAAIASIVRHEDTHVIQRHNTPFYGGTAGIEDREMTWELEAYHDQWEFNSALVAADYGEYSTIDSLTDATARASLVRLNPATDPYAASDAVKQAKAERGIIL